MSSASSDSESSTSSVSSQSSKAKGKQRASYSSSDDSGDEIIVPDDHQEIRNPVLNPDFDFDKLGQDGNQIWLIRVPANIKIKHLEGVEIKLPAQKDKSQILANFKSKGASYRVQTVVPSSSKNNSAIGGEEMLGLNVLVPRHSKSNRLYQTPAPITQHLVINQVLDVPDVIEQEYVPPLHEPKHRQPQNLTRNGFRPAGVTFTPERGSFDTLVKRKEPEVEEAVADVEEKPKKKRKADKEEKKSKKSKKSKA